MTKGEHAAFAFMNAIPAIGMFLASIFTACARNADPIGSVAFLAVSVVLIVNAIYHGRQS